MNLTVNACDSSFDTDACKDSHSLCRRNFVNPPMHLQEACFGNGDTYLEIPRAMAAIFTGK